MRAYTHGGCAHRQQVQHFLFGKTSFLCAPDGVQTSGDGILSPTLYQLSHPITPMVTTDTDVVMTSVSLYLSIMYIQATVDPNKSLFTDPTFKFDIYNYIKSMGPIKE